MFENLQALRDGQKASSHFEVLHEGGYKWEASFEWQTPASIEHIRHLRESINIAIPNSYESFLSFSNGATLYKDDTFGQWGFLLYSVENLIYKRAMWREILGLPPQFLVFCECLGDADLLILDTDQPTPDGLDCAVVYAEEAVPVSAYRVVGRSFREWLDHLVVAQGAKFWCWK
jgi:hypothetical protein